MIKVTREEFFAHIGGPENVHPRSEPDYTVWEIVGTRQVVGRSEPGYKSPGAPKRYWLESTFLAKGRAR